MMWPLLASARTASRCTGLSVERGFDSRLASVAVGGDATGGNPTEKKHILVHGRFWALPSPGLACMVRCWAPAQRCGARMSTAMKVQLPAAPAGTWLLAHRSSCRPHRGRDVEPSPAPNFRLASSCYIDAGQFELRRLQTTAARAGSCGLAYRAHWSAKLRRGRPPSKVKKKSPAKRLQTYLSEIFAQSLPAAHLRMGAASVSRSGAAVGGGRSGEGSCTNRGSATWQ